MTSLVFPFGCPLTPRTPSANGSRRLFILGAYPSAFHVAWRPPVASGLNQIKAVAVDNEPEPFWAGSDEASRLTSWMATAGFDKGCWGEVFLPRGLNGSSGRWVDTHILRPLGHTRAEVWITDCLDIYCCSNNLQQRLTDTYDKMIGLPQWNLPKHPSEDCIVRQSLSRHRERLCNELRAAQPAKIVTLGNAALRVFASLVDNVGEMIIPGKLSPDPTVYGQPIVVRVDGRSVEWLPLAHPEAPKPYQDSHKAWLDRYRA